MALSLRQRLIGGFTAAAIAAVPVTAVVNDNGLSIVPNQAEAAATLIDGVPHYNYRGERRQVVEGAGAILSDNAIAIVYYGSDSGVEDAARQAAAELRAQNWPVGIILADGSNTMQIYVNGQPVGNTSNPTADSRQIREAVVNSFNRYQEAAQLAANPAASR